MIKRAVFKVVSSAVLLAIAACAAPIAGDTSDEAAEQGVAGLEAALSGAGLNAQYFNNADFTAFLMSRTEAVDFNWGTGSPQWPIGADTFSVRWTGQVDPVNTSGTQLYQFYVTADDGVRLWIDGVLVIDHWQLAKTANAPVTWGGNAALSGGVKHDIRLEYFEQTGNAQVKLEWESVGAGVARQVVPAARLYTPPNGLNAQYYDERNLTALKFNNVTTTFSSAGASGTTIDQHLAADNWSVRWSGQVQPDFSEAYIFALQSDDGVRMWIDNDLVIDNWTEHSPTFNYSAPISLQAGRRYDIRVEYFQGTASWKLLLAWCSPSQTGNQVQMLPYTKLFATPSADVIYGVPAMAIDRLPYVASDRLALGQSSYSRAGVGADCSCKLINPNCECDPLGDANNYQYDFFGYHVLLEDKTGPGVVYRMWFTYHQNDSDKRIQIYVDGETTPRINMTVAEMTDGAHPPFYAPLVSNRSLPNGSGGFYVYLPIAYKKSITILSPDTDYYYNIEYQHLPAGTPVRSWVGTEEVAPAVWMWAARGLDPKNTTGNSVTSVTQSLAAKQRTPFYEFNGSPSALAAVRVRIPELVGAASGSAAATDILNNTFIYMNWDGEATPSVSAPIGAFFAQGQFGSKIGQAVPAGIDADGWLYMYLPMPFKSRAHIELENKRSTSTANIQVEVSRRPFPDDFGDVALFRTRYTVHPTDSTVVANTDYEILDVNGAGKFVGLVTSYSGITLPPIPDGGPWRFYLEGDERVYIDDSKSPSIHGTGTEDLFDAGWYFENGPFTASVAGNTAHTQPMVGEGAQADNTSVYRFYLQNAIPFRSHIRYSIERLAFFTDPRFAVWSLAYYYSQPAARMSKTDELDVGNVLSEYLHAYVIAGSTFWGSMTSGFEGDLDEVQVTDDGRAQKGSSDFNMTIAAANQGVILRRRFDQGIAGQNATVSVDGAVVGTWYRAGANLAVRTFPNGSPQYSFRWREDDFLIPSRFTAGKTSVHIKIQFVSSYVDWNEFRYTAFSLL